MFSKNDLCRFVKKDNNLEEGIFANINNDLAEQITDFSLPPLVLMAASYARRTVAAGLFLQGIFDVNEYIYASNMFKNTQQVISSMTNHNNYEDTINFQEEAAEISNNFINSYDNRLSNNLLKLMVNLVENNPSRNDIIKNGNYENLIKVLLILEKDI